MLTSKSLSQSTLAKNAPPYPHTANMWLKSHPNSASGAHRSLPAFGQVLAIVAKNTHGLSPQHAHPLSSTSNRTGGQDAEPTRFDLLKAIHTDTGMSSNGQWQPPPQRMHLCIPNPPAAQGPATDVVGVPCAVRVTVLGQRQAACEFTRRHTALTPPPFPTH
jgi:hypothetical protein